MDPVTTAATVDVNPLINYAMESAIALIAVVAAWAGVKFAKLIGVQTDDAFQARMHDLVWDGLHLARAKYADKIAAAGIVNVRSQIIADVTNHVLKHGGAEVKKLGYDDPKKLADAVSAKLEAMQPAAGRPMA